MMRWNIWAKKLRARHSRLGLRLRPAAMVLLARARPQVAQSCSISLRVNLHMPVRMLAPSVPAGPQSAAARVFRSLVFQPSLVRQQRDVFHSVPATAERVFHTETLTRRDEPQRLEPPGLPPVRSFRTVLSESFLRREGRITLTVRRLVREQREELARRTVVLRDIQEPARRARRLAARRQLPPEAIPALVLRQPASQRISPAAPPAEIVPPVNGSIFAPAMAPALPAVNIDSLTDHVMQQMDRRLVAYRERMGRV